MDRLLLCGRCPSGATPPAEEANILICIYIDGWMDGWMDGQVAVMWSLSIRRQTTCREGTYILTCTYRDGWMDGWMDGRMDGWMDRLL